MVKLEDLYGVFKDRIFRIPDYQRGYAWTDKQYREFWEDLICLDNKRLHYTGVLTLKPVDEKKWSTWNEEKWLIDERKHKPCYIVDGQQRLTTCVIFIQVLTELIQKLDKNKDKSDKEIYLKSYTLKDIKEHYLVTSKPPENIIKSYKFGYEVDNPSFKFLRHKIFNELFGGTIEETFYTLNLENAKKFFKVNLNALAKREGETSIETLFEKLTRRFMFNVYDIEGDFDVFVAFETMNNRGKPLSDLELLKNRLIYLTTLYSEKEVNGDLKKKVRDEINESWKEVYHQLGRNKNKPLNDDDFLKAHWIIYFQYTRQKGINYVQFLLEQKFNPKNILEETKQTSVNLEKIEEIKEEPENEDFEENVENNHKARKQLTIDEINDYVMSLKESAKHWYNSYFPENNPDLTNEEQLWIDRLNRIGVTYFRPLIVSTYMNPKITPNDRIKLFEAIERFIFVVFRLSRAQVNYRNNAYYKAAKELYKDEKTVDDIISDLEEDMNYSLTDDGFFDYVPFKRYIERRVKSYGNGFYGWNGLKYFLFEYELDLMKARGIPKISWKYFIKNDRDKVSIEHIYPQTPDKDCWKKVFEGLTEEQKKILQDTLGNLLPLSMNINSSLQNDCFEEKKRIRRDSRGKTIRNGYQNGSYSELDVAQIEKWTPVEIEKRGIRLLDFMERRWKIKLADETKKIDILRLNWLSN